MGVTIDMEHEHQQFCFACSCPGKPPSPETWLLAVGTLPVLSLTSQIKPFPCHQEGHESLYLLSSPTHEAHVELQPSCGQKVLISANLLRLGASIAPSYSRPISSFPPPQHCFLQQATQRMLFHLIARSPTRIFTRKNTECTLDLKAHFIHDLS